MACCLKGEEVVWLQILAPVQDCWCKDSTAGLQVRMLPVEAHALAQVVALSYKHRRSKVGWDGKAQWAVQVPACVGVQAWWDSHSMAGWQVGKWREAARGFGRGSRAMVQCGTFPALAWACLERC